MKKQFFTLLVLLLATTLAAKANPVEMRTVREVAVKFVNANAKVPLRGAEALQLVTTYRTEGNDEAFHIFNTPNGFVIVSADDCATPILGYSDEGRPFDLENIPIQLQGYLQGFVEQIQYGIENHIEDETIAQQWQLVKTIGRLNDNRDGEAVEPLVTTQWDQWYPYNALCPEGCPTGCVATATAQIMNYWQYPVKGVGYIDYSTPGFGIGHHQVAYNETYYQWDSMGVDHVEAISTLMYHVGTSCGTHYNYGDSGSSIESAMYGLQTYFDYAETMQYYRKINTSFTDEQWKQLIKDNLEEEKPVLYAGGGHAWVIDGYDANDMFHMNFGWSGSADGYYFFNVIYASMYNLSDDPEMVVGITPAHSNLNCEFEYQVDEYDERTYSFHDFTKGTYESLLWDFGDGNSDTSFNPTHTYTNDGHLTVTLLTQQGAQMDSIVKTIDIRHNQFFRRVFPYTGDPGSNPAGLVYPVDYDMDGRQDIVVYGMSGISLSHNTDTGFVSNETTVTQSNAYDLAVTDFYNTNKPSLYSARRQSYWNNVDGEYLLDSTFSMSIDADWMGFYYIDEWKGFNLTDYNNDGLTDIILVQNDYSGKIYRNLGKGKFLPLDSIFPAYGTWLDVDNDGDMDCIPYCINDGHGVFHEEEYPDGFWGDFNSDGLPDVFTNGQLLLNSGANGYDTINVNALHNHIEIIVNEDGSVSTTEWPYNIQDYADIDNDGYIEVLHGYGLNFGQCDSIIKIVGNNIVNYRNDYHIPSFSWGDPNGNNSVDVLSDVAWPWGDNHMGTYLNISTTQNLPSSAPTGLYVEISGNDAVLHWMAPSDDHTPSAALTYNIAVGTSPDASDIYSPLSDLATGHRYYMNRGNAGLATLWRVNELPNGTYYWRVQAIDQALAASPFSEVATFTIEGSNIPPAMAEMKSGFVFGQNHPIGKDVFLEAYVDRNNDDLAGIKIDSLPHYGVLTLYGSAVEIGQCIAYDDLDNLCYFNANYLKARDTMFVRAFDGSDYSDFRSPLYLSGMLFEQVEVALPGGKSIWGDFDNDGDLDLATPGGIYQNTLGAFNLTHVFAESKTPIAWVDYNNDSRLDGLFTDSLWVNDGNGGFVAQAMSVGDWADKTDFNDINNNNNVDFVFARNDSLFAKYDWTEDTYLNMQAMRDGGVALGDWNNDGRQDLANTGFDWGNHRAMTVYCDSAGIFVPVKDLEGLGVGNPQWCDYDKDGDLDLLATGSDNNSGARAFLYKNIRGNLIPQEVSLEGIYGNAYWLDFDNDGWLDVLLSGYYIGTRLYRNNQDGNFVEIPPEVSRIPTEIYSVAIGDYDNDGYMDVLLSGTYLMRNMLGSASNHSFSPPSPPIQLQSDVQGSHVALTWESSDPSQHNSYNVYVRKDGESDFVVSPLAETTSGFRKIARLGNAEYKTFFNLNSLDEGTYWWSVQAVDNAYNGGAFAPEQSFTVTCPLSDPTHVYDTVCHVYCFGNDLMTEDGVYMLNLESHDGCDSMVYLHLTLRDDCSAIVYVKPDGSDNNNGYSWQTAKASINAAIELAQQNGDNVIWVAAGVYASPTPIYVSGVYDFSASIYIPNGIQIYGGLFGNESETFDMSNRDFVYNATILDGMDICMVVYMEENTVLDGFTVQNGNGGGVQANSSAIVSNCIIRNNSSILSAGVSGGTMINCLVYGNTSMYAGTVESCNVFSSTIANNYGAQQYPEHIPVAGAANSQLTNCILWNNQYKTAENCTMTYCATDADFIEGEGNILIARDNDAFLDSLYVRFMDPENGNFILSCSSACINMGAPNISGLNLSSVDLQGNPRVMDGRIDMGAFEFDPSLNYINHIVLVSSNLEEGGTVTGEGDYSCGQICSLTAIPNEGYFFMNWTENGVIVSTDSYYSFTVNNDRNLVANFGVDEIIAFADENVKNICVEHWDTNGDGELSYSELAVVITLANAFSWNNRITSFDELQYFINLVSLNENEFSYCTSLLSIVIPNSITSIGRCAFEGCSGLASIEIPSSVTSIGLAFNNCPNLMQIVVDSNNTVYDSRDNCNAIIETESNTLVFGCAATVIPNTVMTIGEFAFFGCYGLTSIEIPSSVTSIGRYAFEGCSGLASIEIPSSVTSIGLAFNNCPNLMQIVVDSNNTVYDSRDNCNAIIATESNTLVVGCAGTFIPNTVTAIGEYAFYSCGGLASIEIPNSVNYIDYYAFAYCGLSYVISQGETPPDLGWGAFEGVDHSIPVYVPCGSLSAYQNAEGWNEFTNIIEQCPFHFTTPGTWSTASNWQGGALPGANDIVFIDAPCQLDQNATVASLTVSDSQSLTLQSGIMLTVTCNLDNTATTGLVIEDGAQLVHNVANVQAKVKKFISPFNGTDDGWHLIAISLTGSIDVESVGHLLEGEYDLYGYDESTAYWMNSKHSVDSITALEAAKGYLYANGEEVTLEFSGTLQNSTTSVTIPLSYTDGAHLAGFNLVGNPFPCNAYLDREYYVLKADGTDIIPEPIPADTPIPPCTAVFVKAEAEGETVEFTRMMP